MWRLAASFCCIAISSPDPIMPFLSHLQGKLLITFCFCAALFFFSTLLLPRSSSGLTRAWSDSKADQRPSEDVALIVASQPTGDTKWLEDAFPPGVKRSTPQTPNWNSTCLPTRAEKAWFTYRAPSK